LNDSNDVDGRNTRLEFIVPSLAIGETGGDVVDRTDENAVPIDTQSSAKTDDDLAAAMSAASSSRMARLGHVGSLSRIDAQAYR